MAWPRSLLPALRPPPGATLRASPESHPCLSRVHSLRVSAEWHLKLCEEHSEQAGTLLPFQSTLGPGLCTQRAPQSHGQISATHCRLRGHCYGRIRGSTCPGPGVWLAGPGAWLAFGEGSRHGVGQRGRTLAHGNVGAGCTRVGKDTHALSTSP